MRVKSFVVVLFAFALAAAASAQTKTSGRVTCKSDPSTPVDITDHPGHAFAVGKAQCEWSGFEVAGVRSKDGVSIDLDEISGDTMSFHGYHVATMDNGDKTTVRYQGTGAMKDGKPLNGRGTWTYVSGTGKFKGIKGKGTFKGTANADGSISYKVDGEYQLP